MNNNFAWGWEDDEIDLAQLKREKEQQKRDSEREENGNPVIDEEVTVKPFSQSQNDVYTNNGASNSGLDLHKTFSENDTVLLEEDKKTLETELAKRTHKQNNVNNLSAEVVMSSGMTVAEYIQSRKKKRSQSRLNKQQKANRLLKDIKLLELEKAVEGEVDNAKEIADKFKEDAKKRTKENKKEDYKRSFRKRKDNRIPPNQKALMKRLGLSEEALYKAVGVHSTLTEKEKAMILSQGYFGTARVQKNQLHHKSHATLGDEHILEFLYRFKIATPQQLAIAVNKKPSTIYGQLNKMYNMGLVSRSIEGKVIGYTLTKIGMAVIRENGNLPKVPKSSGKSEAFAQSYVAACLYSNKINALNLDDFPYNGRTFHGVKMQGEDIVPERLIRSALAKRVSKINGTMKRVRETANTDIAVRVEKEWLDWENKGKTGISPDMIEGNEHFYILYPLKTIYSSYIIPDMVVQRPRGVNGKPNSIAVEVERKLDTLENYKHKLRMYMLDKRVFGKVIYIARTNNIAERVQKAAEEIGFDRYDIVPFVDENGPISFTDSQVI